MKDLIWSMGMVAVFGGGLALLAALAFAIYVLLNRGGSTGRKSG
jgi:hypothetical protein